MRSGEPEAVHPGRRQLVDFLIGKLDKDESASVLRHLLSGCDACRALLAPYAEALHCPEALDSAEPLTDGSEYEFYIARAAARIRRELKSQAMVRETLEASVGKDLVPERPPLRLMRGRRGARAWVQCEALLAECRNLRYEDPEGVRVLAASAAAMSQTLAPSVRGLRALADLQASALAELGNAHRVADDPGTAEVHLAAALRRWDDGTGDLLLLARVMDLTASLYVHQRRFEEAYQLLTWSFEVYRRAGEDHLAGRALLQKAVAGGYDGDPTEAVEVLTTALQLIDPKREPRTTLAGVHSLICFLVDCGHFQEAWDVAWEARPLYAAHGGEVLRIKLGWLEGRTAAGLGHPGRAERSFRKARQAFLARKLPYTAAVVALDLAMLYLERGRTAAARELVEEMLDTFHVLRIRREASAALILLGEAVRQDALTVAVLKRAAAELEKVEA